MARFGQGVMPQLGATDYTPFMQGSIRGSESVARGIEALGAGIGQGIQQYQQNKMLATQAVADFEGAAQADPRILQAAQDPNAPKDVARAVAKLQKDGSLGVRDASMLSTWARSWLKQQGEVAQREQMAAQQQAAMAERLGMQTATALMASGAPDVLGQMSRMGAPLTPGVARFISEQQAQAASTDKARAEAEKIRRGPEPGSAPVFKQQVDELLATNPGMTRQQATNIVLGAVKTSVNPVTGEKTILDVTTGRAYPILEAGVNGGPAATPQAAPRDPSQSLSRKAVAATGIRNSLKAWGQRAAGLAGQLVGKDVTISDAPEVIFFRQEVETAKQELVRALATNPRFPVAEQERILREIDIAPATFTDPQTLRAKIKGVDSQLRVRMENERAIAENRDVSAQERAIARKSYVDISNFLDLLDAGALSDADMKPSKDSGKPLSDDELMRKYGIE